MNANARRFESAHKLLAASTGVSGRSSVCRVGVMAENSEEADAWTIAVGVTSFFPGLRVRPDLSDPALHKHTCPPALVTTHFRMGFDHELFASNKRVPNPTPMFLRRSQGSSTGARSSIPWPTTTRSWAGTIDEATCPCFPRSPDVPKDENASTELHHGSGVCVGNEIAQANVNRPPAIDAW